MSRGVKRADIEEEAGSEENNSLTPQPIDEHSTRSVCRVMYLLRSLLLIPIVDPCRQRELA